MKHISKLPRHAPISITLVGCGGTGSSLLTLLTRIHIANKALGGKGLSVTVIDGDTVSESNIGRQCFYPCDIGLSKSAVLVSRINAAYQLDWKSRAEMVGDKTKLKADVIISCVDTVKARRSVEKAMFANRITYWLDCGNTQTSGQVILGNRMGYGGDVLLPTVLNLFPNMETNEQDSGPSCSLAQALESQDLFINTVVATVAAQLLWKLIRFGEIETHGAFINLETGKQSPLPIDAETWRRFGLE